MKRAFTDPKLEVIRFEVEDTLMTSGTGNEFETKPDGGIELPDIKL